MNTLGSALTLSMDPPRSGQVKHTNHSATRQTTIVKWQQHENTKELGETEQTAKRKVLESKIGTFLNYHKTTILNYGSEFRPLGDLETILGDHPNFQFFSTLHDNGMDYKFRRELSEEERIKSK